MAGSDAFQKFNKLVLDFSFSHLFHLLKFLLTIHEQPFNMKS